MSRYLLCYVKRANNPYYIESISTNIYSIEELCYYLQQNVYLIDKTIINEKLCDWLKNELGLVSLYHRLYAQLEKEESMVNFIFPIFKEIAWLTQEEYKSLQEELSKMEIQPKDMRKKIKADYLVQYGMYMNGIQEYYQLLKHRNPGKLGMQFYASVLENMGTAYAKLFLFEEAADCLWQSYNISPGKGVYRKYLTVLPLYLSSEDYEERLKEIKADRVLVAEIQKENALLLKNAKDGELGEKFQEKPPEEVLEELKKMYHKNACS